MLASSFFWGLKWARIPYNMPNAWLYYNISFRNDMGSIWGPIHGTTLK